MKSNLRTPCETCPTVAFKYMMVLIELSESTNLFNICCNIFRIVRRFCIKLSAGHMMASQIDVSGKRRNSDTSPQKPRNNLACKKCVMGVMKCIRNGLIYL